MASSQAGAISNTNFQFPGQTGFYRGKVRDVYHFDGFLMMIASDRISAFDYVLPKAIPYKGQVLNQIAAFFLEATRDIVPSWLIACPDPNVAFGYACEPFKIEMVIRGYLAGHAWREYQSGKRLICGVAMPEGMKEGDVFPEPIITPATKAEEGHDEDISKEEILERGLASPEAYALLEKYTRALFQRGTEMARERGLILVDTKYEFGIREGEIMLIDEIHTPDSSRYYYLEGYEARQQSGERQKQLSKEFVREWLMAHGFQGQEGQLMPEMPDSFVKHVSDRYIELYEKITGLDFVREDNTHISERISENIHNYLSKGFQE